MSQFNKASLKQRGTSYQVDWSETEWADLPEIISLLSWSSFIRQMGNEVEWCFRDPSEQARGVQEARSLAAQVLGIELADRVAKSLHTIHQNLTYGRVYPNQLKKEISKIEKMATGRNSTPSPAVAKWIELESAPLKGLSIISYLDRYQVFKRAQEAGISIRPDVHTFPRFTIPLTPDTACLELRSIQSAIEVEELVEELCEPSELARVLGEFSNLSIASGGALARIIVTELGRNIGDHAEASGAWLCTRLVTAPNVNIQSADDPTLRAFRKHKAGFVEVIVCDNGNGLISRLSNVLAEDERASVKAKYSAGMSEPVRSLHLIDYAFDRLSSSRRDIVELVHMHEHNETRRQVVASGLYWVWNVVRSHQGILSIRTSDVNAWFDFSVWSNQSNPKGWELNYPEYDKTEFPSCGTMVRICFPLKEQSNVVQSKAIPIYTQLDEDLSHTIGHTESSFSIVWVGDLARSVSNRQKRVNNRGYKVQSQEVLPGFHDNHERHILEELQRNHFPLKDGDILVLDLCGMRTRWAKQSVAPLCHFVLEMNYTSTVGRSAVILWNIPKSDEGLFENGMAIAGEAYSQLEDFRRAVLLVYDDDSVRIFCGWPPAERILGMLRYQGELDLSEAGADELSEDEKRRLDRIITENSHLFDWTGPNRLRLRPWPLEIRAEAWKQGIDWFGKLLEKSVIEEGVHLTPKRGYYFRLPSDGLLVKDFYQFRGVLSNHESCAKIAWHVVQVVKELCGHLEDGQHVTVISVSRSTMNLAQHLAENYFTKANGGGISVWAEHTIEELEGIGGLPSVMGNAILLTDVISSGMLCRRISRVFPNVRWLGTVALLDTRNLSRTASLPQLVTLANGIEIFKTRDTETGVTYTLAIRNVIKTNPTTSNPKPTTAIDEVNVCAVQENIDAIKTEQFFWDYMERMPDSITAGHIPGSYHHYIYHVDVESLLDAVHPDGQGVTLLDYIVNLAKRDLERVKYDPDKTIIMHPPHSTSSAERIGKALQRETGALYRHVLYKDNFAGHWRFSPFVQHGIPLGGRTLVLIDDGTNTGETLMGLIDAATFGEPANVFAYVGITRMSPHKNHLFVSIDRMKNVTDAVNVKFILELNIPVYTSNDCPICKLRNNLLRIEEKSPLISRYARQLKEQFASAKPVKEGTTNKQSFLWRYASATNAAKLREAFETISYSVPASEFVEAALKKASKTSDNTSYGVLLDIGFMICAEPELASATVLIPYIKKLVDVTLAHIQNCAEDELPTLFGLIFYLLSQLIKRNPTANVTPQIDSLWKSFLHHRNISTKSMGQIIAFILAEALTGERDTESHEGILAESLLVKLRETINESTEEKGGITRAFAFLFIREALGTIQKTKSFSLTRSVTTSVDLYELANGTASKFWWHASDYVKANIDTLTNSIRRRRGQPNDILYGPIHALVIAFDELFELQYRLREADERHELEKSGAAIYWEAPELVNLLGTFIQTLSKLTEEIEKKPDDWEALDLLASAEKLAQVWEQLYRLLNSAFDELFPEIENVADARWGEFSSITNLPNTVAEPINVDPLLKRSGRGFIPRTLLMSFLTVAMQNLKTSAFNGWSEEQINESARAQIKIVTSLDEEENPLICVQVIDTGAKYKTEKRESYPHHSRGLESIKEMATEFGAILMLPRSEGEETVVELCMRHRSLGQS